MKFFTVPALLAAALFSAVAVVPFVPTGTTASSAFAVEARLSTTATGGTVQVYYDSGQGLNEFASEHRALRPGPDAAVYRFPLPPGRYTALRFDPTDQPAKVTLEWLRIVGRGGRVVHEIPFSQLKAAHDIDALELREGRLAFVVPAGANDPQLAITFPTPLSIHLSAAEITVLLFPAALAVFVIMALGLFMFDRWPRISARLARTGRWIGAHPVRGVMVVAAVAVIASAYPVVFLGKSYVSPNVGTTLLYHGSPTLPGDKSTETMDPKGSDVGAVMWAHVPYSMLQNRALLHDFELPLWNRYSSAGTPLLAQGQSMFGDPLNFFVVLCNGSSWAWDLKYLAAKWLFATGLGLLVLAMLGDQGTKGPRDQGTKKRHGTAVPFGSDSPSVPSSLGPLVPWSFGPSVPSSLGPFLAALIVTGAAPFIGFFVYRINHPAIFSLSYAPWVLYAWLRMTQALTTRATAGWIVALLLADGSLMNSGTAKEAYMLLLTMNFSGACLLLAAGSPWQIRLAKLAATAWAGGLLLLLTLPIWDTFLHTLRTAFTAYNAAAAYQVQPSLMLGFFDELFYRPFPPMNWVFNPALNFLLLLGLLYFLATLRGQFSNRLTMALAASSLVPLALAFGAVPAAWIVRVPFLGNVTHIDNTFSCALIVLWSVLAGIGFAQACVRLRTAEGRADLVVAALLLFALVFAWIAFRQAVHRPIALRSTLGVVQPGQDSFPVHPFIWGTLVSLLAATVALAWAARRTLVSRRLTPASALVMALCVAIMLWRQGLHARTTGFEDFVVRPAARAPFHAKSAAVNFLREATRLEPARGMGMKGNFFGGWTGVYGLESTFGPDALANPYYHELTGLLPGVERMWDWRLYLEPQNVSQARRALDALNVRYYLDYQSDQGVMGRDLTLLKTADLDIYASPTAWPRAFFTDRLAVYDQPQEFMSQILQGDGRPFAAAWRGDLSGPSGTALGQVARELATRTIAPASHYRLTGNTTSFDVHTTGPGVIVLNEAFLPEDFRAEVNGRSAPVLRLNHTFKGVTVDAAGDYQITFRYWPKNFSRDLVLAGLGALLIAASLFLALRRRRVANPA